MELADAFEHVVARRERAGKRGSEPSATSRRLVELARRRHRVVRLESGSSFIFRGRGEEAMTLAAAAKQLVE